MMNVDNILIFLSGFMIGGFICTRAEAFLIERRFPGEREAEDVAPYMKRLSFGGVFFSVLLGVVAYNLFPHVFIYGLCGGYALFAAKIGM
ncbi:hypothetical protein EP073_06020 [Geovibrio thiophilus]|uniref:Uncharacterized protein n=1 Tax=Geovibrio thiophilus TaxID=139438 RepID=A0A410JY50_9BACT|nr:hypothetical protein [Geovibrio thiophilus]QAR32978.1 hypothetical protein EP073_06020 [Geovibrio thiophilus]